MTKPIFDNIPEQGQLVEVRSRPFVVNDVARGRRGSFLRL